MKSKFDPESLKRQMALGKRVHAAGLTRRELSMRLGVNPSTLGNWLAGCGQGDQFYLKMIEREVEQAERERGA